MFPEPFTMLSMDDLVSLNFTPKFNGKLKIITKKSKKEKEKLVMSTKNSKECTSTTFEDETNYTTNFDEVHFEQPPNLKEIKNIYGKGYELMKQLCYIGK